MTKDNGFDHGIFAPHDENALKDQISRLIQNSYIRSHRGPEGFERPTVANFTREANRSDAADEGKSNVLGLTEGHEITRYTPFGQKRYGKTRYGVFEERRLTDGLPGLGFRSSLQGVEFERTDNSSRAILTSYNDGPSDSSFVELTANDDGKITLKVQRSGFLSREPLRVEDVTNELAAKGITARDIREMQRSIAYDGEVDRSEQQQIISVISKAMKARA